MFTVIVPLTPIHSINAEIDIYEVKLSLLILCTAARISNEKGGPQKSTFFFYIICLINSLLRSLKASLWEETIATLAASG
jgi:hypothetical protein